MKPIYILGTGSYLPERILTNHDVEKLVETSDEWIMQRTGIKERRVAAPEQASSDLALPGLPSGLGRGGSQSGRRGCHHHGHHYPGHSLSVRRELAAGQARRAPGPDF